MSCCNSCTPPASGLFAGNSACGAQKASQRIKSMGAENMGVVDGVHYAQTKINVENMIPILGIAQTAATALQASKAQRAAQGEVFTQPKTGAGKLLGRITGRTQAAEISKAAQSQATLDNVAAKNLRAQGVPVSGSLAFGQEQSQTLKILGVLGAVILGIFYFNSGNKRKRRR